MGKKQGISKFNIAFFRHRLFLRIFWQGCIAAQQLPAWTELEHLFFSLFELKYLFFPLFELKYLFFFSFPTDIAVRNKKKTNQQLALFVVRF